MTIEARPLRLERADIVELVRAATESGAGVWVVINGSSMAPTIPAHSVVHLSPVPPRGPRRGDVVLGIRGSGSPMLHRVRRVAHGRVILKGDNLLREDHALEADTVIAIADRVMIDGESIPIAGRSLRMLGISLRQLYQRLRIAAYRVLTGNA
jgi:hypothetical protein